MTTLTLPPERTLPIDEVRPYWRNPRRVTDEAVNALMESIREYGYQQPIVVDHENVIIVGHTRYAALRRLEVTEVTVVEATNLTPAQVKQFRVVDNRTAEYTSWDYEALMDELTDLAEATPLIAAIFPEVDAEPITQAEVEAATLASEWEAVETDVDFTCPSCYHSFTLEVTRDAVFDGTLAVPEPGPADIPTTLEAQA